MRDTIEGMNGQDLDGRNITVSEAQSHRGGGGSGCGGFRNIGEAHREGGGYNCSDGYGGGGSGVYDGVCDRDYVYGGDGGSQYLRNGSGDGNWRNQVLCFKQWI